MSVPLGVWGQRPPASRPTTVLFLASQIRPTSRMMKGLKMSHSSSPSRSKRSWLVLQPLRATNKRQRTTGECFGNESLHRERKSATCLLPFINEMDLWSLLFSRSTSPGSILHLYVRSFCSVLYVHYTHLHLTPGCAVFLTNLLQLQVNLLDSSCYMPCQDLLLSGWFLRFFLFLRVSAKRQHSPLPGRNLCETIKSCSFWTDSSVLAPKQSSYIKISP